MDFKSKPSRLLNGVKPQYYPKKVLELLADKEFNNDSIVRFNINNNKVILLTLDDEVIFDIDLHTIKRGKIVLRSKSKRNISL